MKLLTISIINPNGTIEHTVNDESPDAIQATYYINEIIERWKIATLKEVTPQHIYTSNGEFYYYLFMNQHHGYLFSSNELASSQVELNRHFSDIACIAALPCNKQLQKLKEKLAHPERHLTDGKLVKEEIHTLREELFQSIDRLLDRTAIQALFKKS